MIILTEKEFVDKLYAEFSKGEKKVFPDSFLESEELENDPDDTPVEEIKSSLRRALQQAKAGQTRPISELWDRIDGK